MGTRKGRRIQDPGWLSSVPAAPDLGALGIFLEAFLRDNNALPCGKTGRIHSAARAHPARSTAHDGSDSQESLMERPRATSGTVLSFL